MVFKPKKKTKVEEDEEEVEVVKKAVSKKPLKRLPKYPEDFEESEDEEEEDSDEEEDEDEESEEEGPKQEENQPANKKPTISDVLLNHEDRLAAVESYLFRLRNAL